VCSNLGSQGTLHIFHVSLLQYTWFKWRDLHQPSAELKELTQLFEAGVLEQGQMENMQGCVRWGLGLLLMYRPLVNSSCFKCALHVNLLVYITVLLLVILLVLEYFPSCSKYHEFILIWGHKYVPVSFIIQSISTKRVQRRHRLAREIRGNSLGETQRRCNVNPNH